MAQYGGLVYEFVISLASGGLESVAIFPAPPPPGDSAGLVPSPWRLAECVRECVCVCLRGGGEAEAFHY